MLAVVELDDPELVPHRVVSLTLLAYNAHHAYWAHIASHARVASVLSLTSSHSCCVCP